MKITPEAERFYLLEEGKIRRDPALLTGAAELFTSSWERKNLEDALIHLIPELPRTGRGLERRDAIYRLFDLNPGALRQRKMSLPVRLRLEGFPTETASRRFSRLLGRAGFEIVDRAENAEAPGAPAELSVSIAAGGKLSWALERKGSPGLRGSVDVQEEDFGEAGLVRRAVLIAEGVFSVRK
jgi:hypothetical protein